MLNIKTTTTRLPKRILDQRLACGLTTVLTLPDREPVNSSTEPTFETTLHATLERHYLNVHEEYLHPLLPASAIPQNVPKDLKYEDLLLISGQWSSARFLYDRLSDENSKSLLLELIAFRALGHRRVKLPINEHQFWRTLDSVNGLVSGHEFRDFMPFRLNWYDLRPRGIDLKLLTTPTGIASLFFQRQYEYGNLNNHVRANPGDVVIDGGGCWGDTALYFSNQVGPRGNVLSFEMVPANLEIFKENLRANPKHAENIEVIEQPLWSKSGIPVHFESHGPGSAVKVSPGEENVRPTTTTIDSALSARGLRRVDFIKMDIEGSELEALKGARNTLITFKPKLAISIYHKPQDFDEITRYIESLNLGYRFFLGHHAVHLCETVLYAQSPSQF